MQQNMYNTPPQVSAMFTSRQIRQMAKHKLQGKWKKAVPVFAIYLLIANLPAIILALLGYSTAIEITPEMLTGEVMPVVPSFGWILTVYSFITAGALSVSLSTVSLNIIRDEDFGIGTLGRGFQMFGQSIKTFLLIMLYSFLWSMIFMAVPMIIMVLGAMMSSSFIMMLGGGAMVFCSIAAVIYIMRYQLSYYVASDNPGMKASFALANSSRLMRGNILNFIILNITFFGWALLAAIPEMLCGYCFTQYFANKGIMWMIIAVASMLIALVAYALFSAYLQSACAVFYSAASGFFRTRESYNPDPQPYTTLTPENIHQEFGNMSGYSGYKMPEDDQNDPERK